MSPQYVIHLSLEENKSLSRGLNINIYNQKGKKNKIFLETCKQPRRNGRKVKLVKHWTKLSKKKSKQDNKKETRRKFQKRLVKRELQEHEISNKYYIKTDQKDSSYFGVK